VAEYQITLANPETLQGRMAAEVAGWPVRTGVGPGGAVYTSEADTEHVMVLGSRRRTDCGHARGGELVLLSQDVDLTAVDLVAFGYHFVQVGENTAGLYWAVEVLVDGERVYRDRPAAGAEAFYLRRQAYVGTYVGICTITIRMQLEG